ncbi:uncharacterized protein HMPREF1541_00992 [Cyphellophora europaea CBS 101466]|uniref:Probable 26S proteasome regulatory subunit p27 n=1 Tax=Cyphellophora europaea (strain CBS 101466) TaxID=1220924 RepID=W2SFI7_CYPE1|nr:uncharacterized protein HMPREF1541_00992 [Cyphellophora europaea CBS 101466]ETN46803.1 hypothetical protein HMPREF1541_00992 [Cyphellophora europaea CBS 101466]
MGRPMDSGLADIHVPSGPTSVRHEAAPLESLTLRQLIQRKDNLEEELKALGSVLDTHGVDMQTNLTDADGFPRADIDVAQVRVTRARIISLRNDWKALMDKIEKGLHEHHAELQQSGSLEKPATSSSSIAAPVTQPATAPETPFATVNSVEPGSPAHEAGLKAGDKIRRFGTAIWSNHTNLRKVAEVTQQNLGRPIPVKVLREGASEGQELDLRLTPRQGWGGRGTLGCHILPI